MGFYLHALGKAVDQQRWRQQGEADAPATTGASTTLSRLLAVLNIAMRGSYNEPSASCTSSPVSGGVKVAISRIRVLARIRWRSCLFMA